MTAPQSSASAGKALATQDKISARIVPDAGLEVLSRTEVARLMGATQGELYELFRLCALAVMNSGNDTDDATEVLERFSDFDVQVVQQDRGIKLEVSNAPPSAFVDGKVIKGIRELLFAALRDIVFVASEAERESHTPRTGGEAVTNSVFSILRNAGALIPNVDPSMVVCWGGHSIKRHEYEYTKRVGYQFGLRGLDICTGCGPGAMKGPMKGAAIGHSKQRRMHNRYMGISEPGIIAAEAPNPICNQLVIMPDIEKRLEAFVRIAHAVVVFPGGVGTAEEILYLLGILLHPDNADQPLPMILTGPAEAEPYFEQIDRFIRTTLGEQASRRYEVIIDDPETVARRAARGIEEVRAFRVDSQDAFFFNWGLRILHDFQQPFHPTHESMRGLALHREQDTHLLSANLRRAFSGIVAGNVKPETLAMIRKEGKFTLQGEPALMQELDALLGAFVEQGRMKLPGAAYEPCYSVEALS